MFYFHPYLGKIPNVTHIFEVGWNHQLDNYGDRKSPKDRVIPRANGRFMAYKWGWS